MDDNLTDGAPRPAIALHGVAHGGEAVGRLGDVVAFAAYGLPGERVALDVTERRPRYVRGRVAEVLEASPDRATPPCPIFGTCGGCHWQHATYQAQLHYKTEVLRDQLTRIGKLASPPVEPAVASPREWHYRNTVQLVTVRPHDLRLLGFQRAHTHEAIAVEHCYISDELITRTIHHAPWECLSQATWEGLQAVELRVVPGQAVQITLVGRRRLTQTETRRFIRTARTTLPELTALLTARAREADPSRLWGQATLTYDVAGHRLGVPAGAFMQVNLGATEGLVTRLLEWVEPAAEDTVADLYAGVGTFSIPLAGRVQTVSAVEAHPLAAGALVQNAAQNERTNVLVHSGTVEEMVPRLGGQVDLVVLDPPRRGCSTAALGAITRLQPRRIAYVSCDPATLARDLQRFAAGGYHLIRACVVDLFPQTYHLEALALLERA